MSFSLPRFECALVLFLCGGFLSAHAASEVWTADSGTWSNSSNWSNSAVPGSTSSTTNTDTATFSGSAGGTVTIDQTGQNIGSISFSGSSTGSYTIGATNGNALLLSSGGSITDVVGDLDEDTISAPLILEPADSASNGSYTFAVDANFSNGITFGGAISGGTTSGSITLNLGGATSNYAGTINGAISNGGAAGGLGITESGGFWILAGNDTYTGATTVDGGSLDISGSLSSASALKLGGNAYLALNSGSSQTFHGTTITPGMSLIITQIPNSALHLGTLTHTTGGMVDISSLTPNSIYTTSNNEGQIIGPWAVYGSGTSLTYAASGGSSGSAISRYSFNTPTTSGSLANMTSATTQYTYSSSVNTIFLANNVTGDTLQFINTGDNYLETVGDSITLNGLMNSESGSLTIEGTGTVVIGASHELDIFTGGGNIKISSTITGTGALAYASVTGDGVGRVLTLAGANTYTGGTYLNSGEISLASSGALGTTGTISFGGGTLQFTASNTTDYSSRFSTAANQLYSFDTNGQSVTLASNIVSSGGSLTDMGIGALILTGSNSFSGGVFLQSGGTVDLGSSGAIGTAGMIYFNGGTLQFSAGNTTDYSSRFSASPEQSYALDTNGQSVTLASNLTSNEGTLTKYGSGTLTLSGSNPYSGGTTVRAGALLLGNGSNGSATGSGTLSVVQGATIGGAGSSRSSSFTINGNVLVGNGTDVTSQTTITGTSASTLSGANLMFNLGAGANQGQSNVLNLGATPITIANTTLTLNVVGSGIIAPDTSYTLIAMSGPINAAADGLTVGANGQITGGLSIAATGLFGASTNGYTSGFYSGSYLYINGDDIDVEVVPEPSTWGLMLGGVGVLFFWRTRRRV